MKKLKDSRKKKIVVAELLPRYDVASVLLRRFLSVCSRVEGTLLDRGGKLQKFVGQL